MGNDFFVGDSNKAGSVWDATNLDGGVSLSKPGSEYASEDIADSWSKGRAGMFDIRDTALIRKFEDRNQIDAREREHIGQFINNGDKLYKITDVIRKDGKYSYKVEEINIPSGSDSLSDSAYVSGNNSNGVSLKKLTTNPREDMGTYMMRDRQMRASDMDFISYDPVIQKKLDDQDKADLRERAHIGEFINQGNRTYKITDVIRKDGKYSYKVDNVNIAPVDSNAKADEGNGVSGTWLNRLLEWTGISSASTREKAFTVDGINYKIQISK